MGRFYRILESSLLSSAVFFMLTGVILLSIAFGTDFWLIWKVWRPEIRRMTETNATLRVQLSSFNTSAIYFERNLGVFSTCFPSEHPIRKDGTIERTWFGYDCESRWRDYQIPEIPSETRHFTNAEFGRIYKLQTFFFLYVIGLFISSLLPLVLGPIGCCTKNRPLLFITGALVFIGVIGIAAALVVWQTTVDMELTTIPVFPYYRSWHPVLKENSRMEYGWSFWVAWSGAALLFPAGVALSVYACIIKTSTSPGHTPIYFSQHYAMGVYGRNDRNKYLSSLSPPSNFSSFPRY